MFFDMDRAFVAYTNGVRERFYTSDYLMLNATINATIMGNQECDSRIPSSFCTTGDETSESRKPMPYGGWLVLLSVFSVFSLLDAP
jgi:hypothetical protein